jgi:hypothetical protein
MLRRRKFADFTLSKTWSRNHAATSIATEGRLILDPARHFFASALTLFNSELFDLLSHPQRAAQYARVRGADEQRDGPPDAPDAAVLAKIAKCLCRFWRSLVAGFAQG